MNTIQDEWKKFSDRVIPEDASAVQYYEMKRSFYAGAYALLAIMWEIGSDDVSEKAGTEILSSIKQEIEDYFNHRVPDEYKEVGS